MFTNPKTTNRSCLLLIKNGKTKNKSKNAYRSVSNLLEIKKEIILNKTQML